MSIVQPVALAVRERTKRNNVYTLERPRFLFFTVALVTKLAGLHTPKGIRFEAHASQRFKGGKRSTDH